MKVIVSKSDYRRGRNEVFKMLRIVNFVGTHGRGEGQRDRELASPLRNLI